MTPRQDLTYSPLPSPDLTMFVDGSSILDDQGGRPATYAIVTIEPPQVLFSSKKGELCPPMGGSSKTTV
jgi:hypothetical protein